MVRIIARLLLLVALSSCSTLDTSRLPASFNTENIMKVHQGMSSNEVLAMFGTPKSVESAVCGSGTGQWNCTTWKYGEFPYDRASFTFNGSPDSLILNNFSIDRK